MATVYLVIAFAALICLAWLGRRGLASRHSIEQYHKAMDVLAEMSARSSVPGPPGSEAPGRLVDPRAHQGDERGDRTERPGLAEDGETAASRLEARAERGVVIPPPAVKRKLVFVDDGTALANEDVLASSRLPGHDPLDHDPLDHDLLEEPVVGRPGAGIGTSRGTAMVRSSHRRRDVALAIGGLVLLAGVLAFAFTPSAPARRGALATTRGSKGGARSVAPTTLAPRQSSSTTTTIVISRGAGPTLVSLQPATGRAGQTVTLDGTGLFSANGRVAVTFGLRAAPTSCPSEQRCLVTVPPPTPGSSSAPVRLSTESGLSNVLVFAYR